MGGMANDRTVGGASANERGLSDNGRRVSNRSHPLLRLWALSTAIFFCLCAAWSLATPIGASNDEPAQLVKAASVARGEIVGRTVSKKLLSQVPASNRVDFNGCLSFATFRPCRAAVTVVTVPSSIADFSLSECFTLFQQIPAGCDPGLRGSGTRGEGNHLCRPVPSALLRLRRPSLTCLPYGHGGLLDAPVAALASALFLGLALALAAFWSRSRLLVAAVAVAASAMVVIFSSVVNPSGLECATAICVWTGGLVLILDQPDHPRTSVVVATAVAASVMVSMRGLSPVWLVIIAVSLLALSPRSVSALLRSHSIRVAMVVVGLISVVAVGYILGADALSVYPIGTHVAAGTSEWGIVRIALDTTGLLIREFVGTFGWAETSPPVPVLVLWLLSAVAVVLAGLCAGLRRHASVVVALILASVVIPTGLMVSQAHKAGLVWQARDDFPSTSGSS